jgi:hypothetical protein
MLSKNSNLQYNFNEYFFVGEEFLKKLKTNFSRFCLLKRRCNYRHNRKRENKNLVLIFSLPHIFVYFEHIYLKFEIFIVNLSLFLCTISSIRNRFKKNLIFFVLPFNKNICSFLL